MFCSARSLATEILRQLPALDGPIRANRFADSHESSDSRKSFQGSRTEPLLLRIPLRGLKIANRGFEGDSRESLARCENRVFFLGQESCRTKVSRIFRIFAPNLAPNFAPNFPRIFRGLFVLRFVGDGDQKKFTFWRFLGLKMPKALKKHSLGHSEAGAQNCPKSTPGGTFRPGP